MSRTRGARQAAALLALAVALPAMAARKHPVQAAIDEVLAPLPGTYGYVIRDLDANLEWSRNADALFPLASAAKVFIALTAVTEIDRGNLSLAERLPVTRDLQSPPSGILQDFDTGLEPTVGDLLGLLVARSDNTAADVLTRRLSIEKIRETVAASELYRTDFTISNRAIFLMSMGLGKALKGKGPAQRTASWKMLSAPQRIATARAVEDEYKDLAYDDFLDRFLAFYGGERDPWRDPNHLGFVAAIDNKSTARDMADMYTRMVKGELVNERVSSQLLDTMSRHDRFDSEEEVHLDPDVTYAHKGGTDGGIRSECGVMVTSDGRAIVLALLGQGFLEGSEADAVHPVDEAFLKVQELLASRLGTRKAPREKTAAPAAAKR